MTTTPSRLAVVDVGSNSVRLFLCEGADETGPMGERFTTVTGLRRGAAADGTLAEAALERLDACLTGYGERLAAFGPVPVLAVGTSAVRDAPNRDRVDAIVEARLGASLTVLGGDQEAAVSFAGARLGVGGVEPILVLDIGGGSTELVRGRALPDDAISLQLGAVRQTERHLASDPPTAAEVAAVRAEARAAVDAALAAFGTFTDIVGVAGTITTLVAIEIGGYDRDRVHRHVLTRATVERITAELAALPLERRREVPGLEPERARVIVAGALIAAAVLDSTGRDAMVVSERDLLDGVVLAAWDPSIDLFRL